MGTLRVSVLDEYSGAELVAATKCGETHAFEKLVFVANGEVLPWRNG
jgi:hypothetical protein